MRNIALLLQYDGLPFRGWQVQPRQATVQETLETALVRIAGERIRLTGSGRTDAGVHALGQVASFRTSSPLPPSVFERALNSLVPPAISVVRAQEAPPEFDARRSASGKVYRYLLSLGRSRNPFERGRVWQVPCVIAVHPMRRAARHFPGRRDFSSFRASGCSARNPVRTIRRLDIRRRGDRLEIEVEADGFLRHMVRNIVGTLVDVGRGRLHPDAIPAVLGARDRREAGPAAPPHGLYLVQVDYPPPFRWEH